MPDSDAAEKAGEYVIQMTKEHDSVGGCVEAIVKGDPMPAPGIPEALNVILHELRGLGLSISLD